jgi:hypothetical protein
MRDDDDDDDVWSIRWSENWQGKPKYLEIICPSATLSTTNPIWHDLGWNPGHRGGKSATNRYGTAKSFHCIAGYMTRTNILFLDIVRHLVFI